MNGPQPLSASIGNLLQELLPSINTIGGAIDAEFLTRVNDIFQVAKSMVSHEHSGWIQGVGGIVEVAVEKYGVLLEQSTDNTKADTGSRQVADILSTMVRSMIVSLQEQQMLGSLWSNSTCRGPPAGQDAVEESPMRSVERSDSTTSSNSAATVSSEGLQELLSIFMIMIQKCPAFWMRLPSHDSDELLSQIAFSSTVRCLKAHSDPDTVAIQFLSATMIYKDANNSEIMAMLLSEGLRHELLTGLVLGVCAGKFSASVVEPGIELLILSLGVIQSHENPSALQEMLMSVLRHQVRGENEASRTGGFRMGAAAGQLVASSLLNHASHSSVDTAAGDDGDQAMQDSDVSSSGTKLLHDMLLELWNVHQVDLLEPSTSSLEGTDMELRFCKTYAGLANNSSN